MASLPEELIKTLHSFGVRYVFGIPGGPSIPYLDAMRRNEIEFVNVANEQSAGIMADIFGRLTGVPGVCHATFGPGATNLSTGIGGAFLDRSPVVAFTTEVKEEDLGRKVQMNIDHQALFKPLTKWTTRLSWENYGEVIPKAFRIAASEAPGPVNVGLPTDLDEYQLDNNIKGFERDEISLPDPKDLEKARSFLEKARMPIIAVGLTAARFRLKSIGEFAEKNGIPVVLTPMAKGIVPETHPSYGGVLFHARSEYVAEIYRNADLIIGIGYDPVEFNYETWMPMAPLIHIDTEPADITDDHDLLLEIVGKLDVSVDYLNSMKLPAYHWDFNNIRDIQKKMYISLRPKTIGFNPSDAIDILQGVMPKDGILTSDVGAHLHLLGQMWKVSEPGRFIITNGWSSMGFGIPAAIAAKLCCPTRTVACITGDGGFLMNCGELMTARRLNLNIVIIVFADSNLSLIEVKQKRKNVMLYGTSIYDDEGYFQADHFLGVPILKVRDREEMKVSLERAFAAQGPVIVEASVDGSVYEDLIARSYK